MTAALIARVAARIDRLVPRDATVVAAVSGGADSLALIELLRLGHAQHRRSLAVVHVDHGITPASGAAAELVGRYAAERELPCQILRLTLGRDASETAARRARRQVLRQQVLDRGDHVIALGHHRDDQIETVLLRLLRGSGPLGLAAMAPRRGRWIRPLLSESRDELEAFVRQSGLEFWTDPANSDPRHLRSWLRTEVLPRLADRLPDVHQRLADVAERAAELRQGVNAVPEMARELTFVADSRGISVAAAALSGYRSAAARLVIGAVARRMGRPIGGRQVDRIMALLGGRRAAGPIAVAPGLEVELAFGRLHFRTPEVGFAPIPLPDDGTVCVAGHRLTVTAVAPGGGEVARQGRATDLAPGSYLVRPWRAGDRIRPWQGTGSRSVAVLLREARVPVGARRNWPVVVTADEATIVWVPGICRAAAGVPEAGERARHVVWDFA